MMSSYDAKGSSCRISNKSLLPLDLHHSLFLFHSFLTLFFSFLLHVVFVHTSNVWAKIQNTPSKLDPEYNTGVQNIKSIAASLSLLFRGFIVLRNVLLILILSI